MKREDKFATITFWLVILIGPLFVGRWIYLAEQRTQKQEKARQVTKQQQIQKQQEKELEQIKREKVLKSVAWMQECRNKGIITHLNEGGHIARMNPLVWCSLPLEAKRGFVNGCSVYFEVRTGLPGATILSNQNDTKLGDMGWLGGIKIYH